MCEKDHSGSAQTNILYIVLEATRNEGEPMTVDANELICDDTDCAGNVVLDFSKLPNGPTRPLDEVVRAYASAQGWSSIDGVDRCPLHSPNYLNLGKLDRQSGEGTEPQS
jgi:hypothetical protein